MESLKGSLLIAAPSLVDPNFARTVVLMAEHNKDGALGLVLNRPASIKLSKLWGTIAKEEKEEEVVSEDVAFTGGPVQKNALLFLHGHPEVAGDAEPIIPGVYMGGEIEVLGKLLRGEVQTGELEAGAAQRERDVRVRVFCGYSGWGAGQLDREMEAGGWLTLPAKSDHIFHDEPLKLWGQTMKSLGGEYSFFSLMPPKPELN